MAEEVYRLVFSGEIAPGRNPAKVKQQFAALYKKDIATIERSLFSGKSVIVKDNLEHQIALNLQALLSARTGAVFDVWMISAPRQTTSSDEAASAPPPEEMASSCPSTAEQETTAPQQTSAPPPEPV
jgi:hypothetical protein